MKKVHKFEGFTKDKAKRQLSICGSDNGKNFKRNKLIVSHKPKDVTCKNCLRKMDR